MKITGKDIGKKLSLLRDEKGITIEQMSKDLNMKTTLLEEYEKDASNMGLLTLEKILKYFAFS